MFNLGVYKRFLKTTFLILLRRYANNKMLTYHWRTKLKIQPSLRSPEIINGYNFEVQHGETFVTIKYETPSFDAKLPDRRDNYEYADQTIARQHADQIRSIMLTRMIYIRMPEILRVDIVSGPTLLNKDALDAAGVHKLRDVASTFGYSRAILDVGQTLSESKVFWSKGFTKKSAKHEEDLLRIADWVVNAELESSHYKRFILRWIAFNGLYGLYDTVNGIPHKKDKDKIEQMLIGLLANNADEIVRCLGNKLDLLETYGITSESGKTNYSSNLAQERRKSPPNSLEVIKLVTLCIYGIRKEVFHEAPEPDDIESRCKTADYVLSQIVMACLKNFVNY
ncbi:MAG: hypothetical protein HW406_456 [Candidatus Brocadiaceae bacterium]|nr:hypothetical protein [Candidatus Brocadiaceae bacterium]